MRTHVFPLFLWVRPFRCGVPLSVLWPRLTPAISAPPHGGGYRLSRRNRRPPRIRTSSFRSCTCPSLLPQSLAASDFALCRRLVRLKQPQIGFVYLRSSFCLQLPSDSASRLTPLLLANGRRSPAPVRDFHPIDDAHAGRTTKKHSQL